MSESQPPDASEEALLVAAKEGDRAALGQLLDRVGSDLEGLVARLAGSDLRARVRTSDLRQSAFLEVLASISGCRAETFEEFQAWARQVVRNAVAREARFQGRARRAPDREAAISPDDAGAADSKTPSLLLGQAEQRSRLFEAIEELEPRHRQVVTMRLLEGASYETIAETFGLKVNATRNLMLRARAALAVRLEARDRT